MGNSCESIALHRATSADSLRVSCVARKLLPTSSFVHSSFCRSGDPANGADGRTHFFRKGFTVCGPVLSERPLVEERYQSPAGCPEGYRNRFNYSYMRPQLSGTHE